MDELEAELAAATSERQKIDLLNSRARELRDADSKRGLSLAKQAFALAEIAQYPQGLAESLVNQSYCNGWLGHFGAALSQGLKALEIFEQIKDLPGLTDTLCALARAHLNLGNYPEAAEMGHRAQILAQEQCDPLTEAEALNIQGITYKRAENLPLALEVYAQALALYQALGNRMEEGRLLNNMALVHSALGQYDEALALVHKGLQLAGAPSHRRREGYTQHTLGHIYKDMRAFDQALHHFQLALEIGNELENRYLCLDCLHQMGKIYIARHQPELALSYQQQALEIAKGTESKRNIYRCYEALAEICENQGDLGQALAHYKQFHIIKEAVFNEESAGRLVRLEIQHKTETSRKEAEIYHLKNVALEQEMAERMRLEYELQQQASTDSLTGVMNRRHFLDIASREMKRTARFQHPMSLALLDIDHFKQINDTYGHAAGDQALQRLAKICQNTIREIDVFARFGGDEFALLLPEANLDQAVKVVERVRLALATLLVDVNGHPVSITISAGISNLESHEVAVDLLLARADQALYQAKESGRNRIVVKSASE